MRTTPAAMFGRGRYSGEATTECGSRHGGEKPTKRFSRAMDQIPRRHGGTYRVHAHC